MLAVPIILEQFVSNAFGETSEGCLEARNYVKDTVTFPPKTVPLVIRVPA
jgi:hypothetical protein